MMAAVDADTQSMLDQLSGYLVGALHGMTFDVEWHHDGRHFIPAFTVTDPRSDAAVVIHIDPAGA
jgi:hypothetical protein